MESIVSEPTRRAVVIGASSGIGESIARQLARDGAIVALVARRQSELERVASQIGAEARTYVHDVREFGEAPGVFSRIVADLGGLDTVVYAAGTMPTVDESEYDFAKDRQMIEVNLLGAMLGSISLLPLSRRNGAARLSACRASPANVVAVETQRIAHPKPRSPRTSSHFAIAYRVMA